MIVDADCHLSSKKFDSSAMTADELIDTMGRAGVDKALVWLRPSYTRDIAPENRAVHDAVVRYPGRLIAFGWANPRLGADVTRDTIRRCFEEYGFCGIKFNGAQDDYVIDDAALAMPHIEMAARYGKPVAFHIGADSFENTHPYRLGHIAAKFPETQFLMVHMGGAATPTLERSAIETARANANITLIASAIGARGVTRALEALGAHRVCFGSDEPFAPMHVQLAMFQAMLRDHPDSDTALVLGQNILRVCGRQPHIEESHP